MKEKKRPSFPKDFFSKSRPKISTKEALKDIVPINWSDDTGKDKTKTIAYSINEKKI